MCYSYSVSSYVLQLGSSTQNGTLTLQPDPSNTSNTSNRTGTCYVTIALPDVTGNYTADVTVNPGSSKRSSDAIVIDKPSQPVVTCPSDYVPENSDVTCTCSTTKIGQPGGRLQGYTVINSGTETVFNGNYDVTSLTMTWNVSRADHVTRRFGCRNKWISDVTEQSQATVKVASGPDSVTVQGDDPFYTDTSGSQALTLTCNATAEPTSALTFQWNLPCDGGSTQRTCTFRPRPPGDVNRQMTCTAVNTKNNNRSQQGSVTLNLKYPPTSPVISGYDNNTVLYQNNNLSLTCNVTGGDPAVTSVTLTCPGGYDGSQPTTGTVGRLDITSLRGQADDGLVCVCSGQWARPDLYTLTDARRLTVYYPPSTPVINRSGGTSRPLLENDSVTLTCSLTSPGHPIATLTWREGQRPNITGTTLQLTSVGRGDHLKNFTCVAINNYTVHMKQELSSLPFTLRVYYKPVPTLKSLEGNQCAMTSQTTQCVITEGQRVHFRCDADSNPAPDIFTWQPPSGSDLHLPAGRDIDIVKVNRSHSGRYQVTVVTSKPDASDDRLPLTSSPFDFTVLVKYEVTEPLLGVDNNVTLTINESEAVTFTCQSRGRPTPRLELRHKEGVVKVEDGGELSADVDHTQLTMTLQSECNNTGRYTCTATNDVGQPQQSDVTLYVNCKPRVLNRPPAPPKLNFVGKPVNVSFDLLAFPLPTLFTFRYHGNTQSPSSTTSDVSPGTDVTFNASCVTTYADYAVTCYVYVNYVKDASSEGTYSVEIANEFGSGEFSFQLTFNATSLPTVSNAFPTGAVAGGIVAAVLVIAVVAVVVILFRRRKQRRHSASQRNPDTEPSDSRLTQNGSSRSDVYEISENPFTQQQEPRPSSNYAGLELSDIGQRSVYSQFSPYQNTGVFSHNQDSSDPASDYSRLEVSDIGVRSEYSQMSPYQNTGTSSADNQGSLYQNTRQERNSPYANVSSPTA